ncbi:hypothetical protein [Bifidobacterium longum]
MMRTRGHQAAFTSCNQAIRQSDTIRTDWGKALKQAEPYLRLGDGDVQDPKTLELVAAITRYRLPEPPAACDPDMTTGRLDHRRTAAEGPNGQIQARTKDLRDAVGKATASRERKQLADAREKLRQAIERADTLYRDSVDRTDDARPHVDLGAELDHVRHTAHGTRHTKTTNPPHWNRPPKGSLTPCAGSTSRCEGKRRRTPSDNVPRQIRAVQTLGARNHIRKIRMPANPANPGTNPRHSASHRGIRIKGISPSSRANYVSRRK